MNKRILFFLIFFMSTIFWSDAYGQFMTFNGTTMADSGGGPSNCTAGNYKPVSATVSGNCVTFTTNSFQNGAIWACSTIDLNQSFKVNFNANFGNNTATGDGIAFLLQREGAPQVIGGAAGGIGYAQGNGSSCQGAAGGCPITPSVAVEFDTWDNTSDGLNDIVANHIAIHRNGEMNVANTLAGPISAINSVNNIRDGLDHAVCITWDPAINRMQIFFDGNLRLTYNGNIRDVFGSGANTVWWGFTSGSGGSAQTQRVCSVQMQTNIASPSCLCTAPVATATPNPQTICSGNATGVNLTSSITGTTFSWVATANANVTGESTTNQTGSSITDVLVNTTATAQIVTYTVTPTAAGCVGTAITVPVTVSPVATINPMTVTVCTGNLFTVTPVNVTNGVVPAGTTYSWSAPVVTGGMTGGASGTNQTSISGTLTNPTNTPQTATYTVTPTSGTCVGATFTLTVTVNPAPAITAMTNTTCSGVAFTSTPVNVTNGVVPAGTTYSWSAPVVTGGMTGGASGTNQTSISGTLTNPTSTPQTATYTITPTSGSCSGATFTLTVTVNPIPAAPTASVTVQPTCTTPTGTILVTAPTGTSIQYSIGGAYQSSGTFSGLAPGSYNVTAQDTATGCISSATVLVVNPLAGAPVAPTASVTVQPTCTTPTGTIVVTAPTGASIQYSIGGAYQSSGTFAGLAAGSYNVTAQDTATGCISSATVLVVNPIPANPVAPTASVTVQPTCTTPTGTIVVTAPTGSSIQYSIGGAYQSSGTFAGLAAGSYNVTAQDTATGCISSATVLVVNPIPANPAAPTASVTVQPTCTIPTGTIVVTAPTGASIQYSIGGAYQSSGTFSGLTPGSYNATAQDTATGCISSATVLVVNPIPANPAAPTASVTVQPTCTTPTGTILVTAPTGTSIQYSIGGAYQSSGTFSGLAPGSYNVTAQDTATGCISSATVLVVNPIPANPDAPTASVTVQPTCATPTGTIVVTAPTGASIQYSIGGAYQSSGTFAGLAAGSYNVTAQDTATGCISSVTVVVVNPPAGAPAAPTASVTVQPTCTIPTGTIVVTAPIGASIQYSIGGAYQSSGTFAGLAPGSYNVTAQDTATGCTSSVTVLVVNPIPANPDAPTASVTVQPTCTTPAGTIVVTAPTGASIQYSIGGAYQSSGTFSGLTPGSYSVTAQNTSTGCTSTATVLVVNAIPANPAAPTASVTVQPTCTIPTGTIVVTAPTGASIQYSIGGAYQSSGTFSGLAPGSYNVIAQNTSTGCTSTATVLVVNAIPANPAAPTASVTVQPTCTTPTGTIVVTAPTGASIQYSVGGAYQSSGTFSGLASGSYNVTAQDTATGCISAATVLVVNSIPAGPAAPTASVAIQPSCTTPTGTIVVTAPTGASIQYSIGGAYQSSGTFSGLTPGSYSVTARDTSTGCTSTATVLVVNAIPAGPAVATVTVTQPSCATPTATILVLSPIGANLEYSINNGVSYQTSTSFSGLAPSSSYTIRVRDVVSGCVSNPSSNIIIDAVPASPVVTLSSGCNGSSYEIVASTTSSSATYQWYSGSTLIGSTSTVVISNIGTYQVDVTVAGCTTTEFITIDNVTCSIPKGISPNGDGLNDSWDISGLNARKVQIFNRYGVEVYSRPNYTNEFEGKTNNGNELPTGTYYYVITLDNGAKTGWLYINR
jgi:gliding motility-associated-like protein